MRTTGDSILERAEPAAMAKSCAVSPEPRDTSELPTQRFWAQSGVSAARAAGTTVLLDVRGGLYHTLNESASRLWDVIEPGDATLSTLIDVLDADYEDVPRETIVRDVKRLLETFLEADLITAEPVR